MIEYECFDFSTFCLNHQISNLLEFLNTLDGIEGQIEAFEHFLPVFPKAASRRDTVFFIQIISIMHRDLKLSDVLVSKQHYCKKISVRINGQVSLPTVQWFVQNNLSSANFETASKGKRKCKPGAKLHLVGILVSKRKSSN